MATLTAGLSPAQQLLQQARDHFQSAENAEAPLRKEGELDLEFLNLNQWDPQVKLDRESNDKPTLVIDQIGEPYRQLVGQLRRAHPGIQISPVDSGADIETAERYQGAIRHIEVTGGAKAAREEAFKGAVGPGWGYYRLYTDYDYDSDPKGTDQAAIFDQCIKYQAIDNAFTVYRDPACPLHEPWKARRCVIVEDVPKEEFKRRWPKAIATADDAFAATGTQLPDWYPETSVRVADYFYLETVDGPEMALLADGQVVPAKQVQAGAQVVQKRKPQRTVVKLAKMTGAEILEGNEDLTAGREQPWPFIPVVPMYGEALTVKGKRFLRGIVRAARDSQRAYNFQTSELMYELALSPKSKVIMAEGQDEGYEDQWRLAPTKAFPALKYKPTSIGGERVPEPSVAQFTDSAKIQALVVGVNQSKTDCRTTTGWYDSTDPNRKNADQSGRAILARREAQAEGSINFLENFAQALKFEGMLLLGAIPKLYNRPGRGIRIAGLEDDTKSETLEIGQPVQTKDGQQAFFQWGAGRYDVTVSTGASYGTRRQEAADFQMELMKVLPEPMAAAMAPIAVRNMDGPGNKEIADRLDRTLPPEIRGEDEKGKPPMPPEVQQQMQQMSQMNEALTQQLEAATQVIKTEEVKAQRDVAKAREDNATKIGIAQLQADAAADQALALQVMKNAASIAVAHIAAAAKGAAIDAHAREEAQALGVEAEQRDLDRAHEMAIQPMDGASA